MRALRTDGNCGLLARRGRSRGGGPRVCDPGRLRVVEPVSSLAVRLHLKRMAGSAVDRLAQLSACRSAGPIRLTSGDLAARRSPPLSHRFLSPPHRPRLGPRPCSSPLSHLSDPSPPLPVPQSLSLLFRPSPPHPPLSWFGSRPRAHTYGGGARSRTKPCHPTSGGGLEGRIPNPGVSPGVNPARCSSARPTCASSTNSVSSR
jgi:hypothetical protein